MVHGYFSYRYFRDRMHGSNPTSKLFNMAIGNETWPARVLSRFTDVFTSHVIQVDIETAGISKYICISPQAIDKINN